MSISKKLRFEVLARDGFKCVYCGRSSEEVILEIDHMMPKSKGGKDEFDNLVAACFDCNRGKRDLVLKDTTLILQPVIKSAKERTIKWKIMKFIITLDPDQSFYIYECYKSLGADTLKKQNAIRIALSRLVNKGVLERQGERTGVFKAKDIQYISIYNRVY